MMEIGLVGKPNVGKTTFFSAITLIKAEIANYPFTTIEPNRGVTYLKTKCPHEEFGVKCNPRNSICENGIRYVPIEIIDVAGLVPDAHKGKGLGNKFLDDLRQASALIHIIDASGGTDEKGNICAIGARDPVDDVQFLNREISFWIKGIIEKGWNKISKQAEQGVGKLEIVLAERLAGLGITENQIRLAFHNSIAPIDKPSKWSEEEFLDLIDQIRKISKPMIIAANKCEIAPKENIDKLSDVGIEAIPTSAESELALRRAAKAGLIKYTAGDSDFEIADKSKLTEKQLQGLEQMRDCIKKFGDTGVQKCIEKVAYKLLDLIVVYPVEDESKLTDKDGRVLPDAHLIKRGSTARDLAYKVHTDLGKNFIRAINVRTKRTIGAGYVLLDGDVIKIVT
ncbi:MAG: redox-regulated ATPase YchF [Thermoplasmata archaeon]